MTFDNLVVVPIIRTVADLRQRIGNWLSEPVRWAVLGEAFVLAAVALDDLVSSEPNPTYT